MLLFVSGAFFVIGAFAADGNALLHWPAWTWGFLAFAAWVLHGVFPIPIMGRGGQQQK